MASAKPSVMEVLRQMPEECTLEDIQYQLYLRQRIDESLAAAAKGRVVPHGEVKKRLSKWLTG